jgi:hypothetical protein
MERDINLIVPVDPDEAQVLIDLIEILFEEWYIARERRRLHLGLVAAIANEKNKLKRKLQALPPPEESSSSE